MPNTRDRLRSSRRMHQNQGMWQAQILDHANRMGTHKSPMPNTCISYNDHYVCTMYQRMERVSCPVELSRHDGGVSAVHIFSLIALVSID